MSASSLLITRIDGTPIRDGVQNNLFPDGSIGDPVGYQFFEVRNTGAGALTGGRIFLAIDPGGGSFAIAVANNTPQDVTLGWAAVDTTTLTYSSPASAAAGLAIGSGSSLAPGQKVLYCARRDLTSGTTKRPEVNRIVLSGTVPIGF